MQLRPYQKESINLARQSFAKGNKDICLCLATGSGKSIIARKIVEAFREKMPNGKIAYLTFRNVLINQMKDTLKGLNVEIDTLQAKGKTPTDMYDLVLIDEAHYAKNSKLQNNINTKFKLSLTATPITPDGFALDFDEIIDVVQLADLIEMGYASPVKVLSISNIDTSTLKTTGGDFNQKQSYELMSKSSVKKDILEVYKKYATNLKTIIYCVNVQHAEELKDEFIKAGIECDSVHSKKYATDETIKKFRNNEIKLLFNVDILVTGVDMPDIYCLILASPTKSLIKSTQIYGRATRLNPNDPNKTALIIDCAKVIENTQHPLQKFDFSRKKTDKFTKCKCNNKMKLTNRFTEVVNDYEYVIKSDYVCECGETLRIENIKLINMSLCPECNNIFEPKSSLEMISSQKDVKFVTYCKHCNYERNFRTILLSDAELKEISLHQAMQNGATWEDVKFIVGKYVKEDGYHHRYTIRLIDRCKNVNYTPKQVIDMVKTIKKSGKKISQLMYF